jgi:hypothetical protein
MNGGDAKSAYGKLYGPKWLSAERDQMPSSINGAITIRYEDEDSKSGAGRAAT